MGCIKERNSTTIFVVNVFVWLSRMLFFGRHGQAVCSQNIRYFMIGRHCKNWYVMNKNCMEMKGMLKRSFSSMVKVVVASSALALASMSTYANDVKYLLTSHVLDTNAGIPAAGVKVQLLKLQTDNTWKTLDTKVTNDNGRIRDFLPSTDSQSGEGTYKLIFHTKEYYQQRNIPSIYPFVEVNFELKNDGRHYHIPITLAPHGYSTYRGS